MLIVMTGMAGDDLAFDPNDVIGALPLYRTEGDGENTVTTNDVVGTRIHCNRHGVTSSFDVQGSVAEVVQAVNRSLNDSFGRPIPAPGQTSNGARRMGEKA